MRRRFLYFLAGVQSCSESTLQELGILDRFLAGGRTVAWMINPCASGPFGQSGGLVAPGVRPPEYSEKQTWVRGGERWYVGLEDAALPPGPEDLVREIGLDGYEKCLGDGNHWRIPRLLRWDSQKLEHEPAVPRQIQRNVREDGSLKYALDVPSEFKALVEIAKRSWEDHVHERTVSIERLFEDAAAVLAANYRLGPAEVGLLGLIDPAKAQEILGACFDLPVIVAQIDEEKRAGLMFCDQVPE